jgi:nicotinate-nucleotide adenylyltransferase
MNIGLFGGTFDPIHRGHLRVARAAADRFKLRETWFIPADIPPHKQKSPLTSYFHRYSMVALAVANEPDFLPSLLEAPEPEAHMERRPSYTIDTIRKVKADLRRGDRLYFLIGIDAFSDIAKWYKSEELLQECEFIVAARPGYSLNDVGCCLPRDIRPPLKELKKYRNDSRNGSLRLPRITIHLLPDTHEDVSATQIRAAMRKGRDLSELVPDTVADYIRKEGLYRPPSLSMKARSRRSRRTHETK